MPVIVPKGDEDKWLDPQQNDLEMLKKIIVSSPLHLIIE
jgi:putative SOS response-associated peptidase YedK